MYKLLLPANTRLYRMYFDTRVQKQTRIKDFFKHNQFFEFDVYGSLHLGNIYVRLKVQLDAHGFVCILYFTIFALHVSSAICTHHQEHKLQITAIGMRYGYGM
jgi:hypothetical protein